MQCGFIADMYPCARAAVYQYIGKCLNMFAPAELLTLSSRTHARMYTVYTHTHNPHSDKISGGLHSPEKSVQTNHIPMMQEGTHLTSPGFEEPYSQFECLSIKLAKR